MAYLEIFIHMLYSHFIRIKEYCLNIFVTIYFLLLITSEIHLSKMCYDHFNKERIAFSSLDPLVNEKKWQSENNVSLVLRKNCYWGIHTDLSVTHTHPVTYSKHTQNTNKRINTHTCIHTQTYKHTHIHTHLHTHTNTHLYTHK